MVAHRVIAQAATRAVLGIVLVLFAVVTRSSAQTTSPDLQTCASNAVVSVPPGLSYFSSGSNTTFLLTQQATYALSVSYMGVPSTLPFMLQLCSFDELSDLPTTGYSPCKDVADLAKMQACAIGAAFDGSSIAPVNISGVIMTGAKYALIFYSCCNAPESMRLEYSFVTSVPVDTGSQSSQSGDGDDYTDALPKIYESSAALWAALLACWIINQAMYPNKRILIHTAFLVMAFVRLLMACFGIAYWVTYVDDPTNPFDSVNGVAFALLIVHHAIFFTSVALVSKGWCITTTTAPFSELQSLFAVVISMIVTYMLFELYSSFVMVALVIMFVITLRFVMIYTSINIHFLQLQIAFIDHNSTLPQSTMVVIQHKVEMLKSFKRIFGLFVFFTLLFAVGIRFFVPNATWLQSAATELIGILTNACFFSVFRLRDFRQIVEAELDDPSIEDSSTDAVVIPEDVLKLHPTLVYYRKAKRMPVLIVELPMTKEQQDECSENINGVVFASWAAMSETDEI